MFVEKKGYLITNNAIYTFCGYEELEEEIILDKFEQTPVDYAKRLYHISKKDIVKICNSYKEVDEYLIKLRAHKKKVLKEML